MSLRTLGTLAAAALFAAAAWNASGTTRPQAALAAVPKPTPVALQYDEISRFAFAQITPPPPGVFHQDYVAIIGSAPAQVAAATPEPTPAPKKRGLFGSITQIVSGNLSGNAAGQAGVDGGGVGSVNPMDAMTKGTLARYTFYKNWIRIDDPVKQTATISKCDKHEFITLDLAHRTYSISDTDPACGSPPAGLSADTPEAQAYTKPGTADMSLSGSTRALGPKTLESIPTNGWDRTMTFDETNATGSCTNAHSGMSQTLYISRISKPRAYCPLPGAQAESYGTLGARGGCKPTVHATGGLDISDRFLEMYLKTSFAAGNGGSSASVIERGNVKWLYEPQAEALFSVPAGFTQQR